MKENRERERGMLGREEDRGYLSCVSRLQKSATERNAQRTNNFRHSETAGKEPNALLVFCSCHAPVKDFRLHTSQPDRHTRHGDT
jgi:hypothetical protein